MKIKLGSKEVKIDRIQKVREVGSKIAYIYFKTGESIQVTCCVKEPRPGLIAYPGTAEELKALIERHS